MAFPLSNKGVGSPSSTPVDDQSKTKLNTDTDSLPSTVVTLEPYSFDASKPKPQRNHEALSDSTSQRKAKNSKQLGAKAFDKIFGPLQWPRFFTINLKRRDDFLLDDLFLKNGHNITINKLSNGLRLVEAHTELASEALNEWVDNPPDNIEITVHQSLNSTYGTIVVPEEIEYEDEDFLKWGPKILNNLKLHNIPAIKVDTFYAKSRRPNGPKLRIAKIAFNCHNLPHEVRLVGRILGVKPYVGRPRQCKRCWRYGHPDKYCTSNEASCKKCSKSGHDHTTCKSTVIQCVNCGADHQATARICHHYIYNNKIHQFQQKRGFPRRAAINHLRKTGDLPK